MIKAIFIRNQSGSLVSAKLTGHAGSGEYGFDIVCASVSTLAINFVNALEALTVCTPDLQLDDIAGGYMEITVPQDSSGDVQLLFEAFLLGMTNLAENSSEFVQIRVIEN